MLELRDFSIDVVKRGEHRRLVTNVSLQINEGETVALVGESGSGKSVTAMSMMGLLTSWNKTSTFDTRGVLRLASDDIEIDLSHAGERQFDRIRGNRVAIIFQNPWAALNPIMSIGAQLVEAIQAHTPQPPQKARNRAVELMDRVSIPHPAERFSSYPHQLSGGQLQRIMIAMALAGDPSFLIADEPTTALDVTVQRGILELLDELRRDGLGILLITHDLSVVASHSDRIAVMYEGRVLERGKSRDVITAPAHPYTQLLVSSVPTSHSAPGEHLVTKADVMSGRIGGTDLGRFDPNQRSADEEVEVSGGHFASQLYTAVNDA